MKIQKTINAIMGIRFEDEIEKLDRENFELEEVKYYEELYSDAKDCWDNVYDRVDRLYRRFEA